MSGSRRDVRCRREDSERKVQAHRQGVLDEERARRAPVPKNTDIARAVVTDKVRGTKGRMSAKRLLPIARAAGYSGSPRVARQWHGTTLM